MSKELNRILAILEEHSNHFHSLKGRMNKIEYRLEKARKENKDTAACLKGLVNEIVSNTDQIETTQSQVKMSSNKSKKDIDAVFDLLSEVSSDVKDIRDATVIKGKIVKFA